MIDYSLLPHHIRDGMKMYIENGIIPGHFLQAAIKDKLVESFSRADDTNQKRMFDIANFLYNEMPSTLRGSKTAMLDHNKRIHDMTIDEREQWIKYINGLA